jgi:N-dimethylarginine dimethylaminohydrolase
MRMLMCPPGLMSPTHLFNPWMEWHEETDTLKAAEEWSALVDLLERCGARIELLPSNSQAPAMTFTRDLVLTVGDRPLILTNDGPRGTTEPVFAAAWMKGKGLRPRWLPRRMRLDGGNVVRRADGRWLVGLKPDSDVQAAKWLGRMVRRTTGAETIAVPLADVRYLHLDMVLADLAGRGWLVYPQGFAHSDLSHPVWTEILAGRPVIEVDHEEAKDLSCNVVVAGDVVVGGTLTTRLRGAIEGLGLTVETTSLDEFRKAGGGAHCLTCDLDGLTPRFAPKEPG